jgi:hypothetical protein
MGQVLPVAASAGSPDGLHEAGVVNRVFKAGRGVGSRMHVADEMSIELVRRVGLSDVWLILSIDVIRLV